MVLQVLGPRPVAGPVLVQDGLLVALEIPCVIVGALISVHRPGNRIGGLLLAGAFALSVFSFLENYFGYAARQPGVLPDLRAVAWIANGALVAGVGALVLMLLLYPTGRLPSRRWRPVAWALTSWGLVTVVLSTVQPTLVMAPAVSNPVGVQDRPPDQPNTGLRGAHRHLGRGLRHRGDWLGPAAWPGHQLGRGWGPSWPWRRCSGRCVAASRP